MRNSLSKFTVMLMILVLSTGCTSIGGPSANDDVLAALSAFHAAEVSGDMDVIMDTYSDDFADPMGTRKDGVEGFFQMAIGSGALRSLEVDMQDSQLSVDGDMAVIGPVRYTSGFGPSSYRYTLKKESDGVWRFVNSEMIQE